MIKIILFLAGNFPQLAHIEKELAMAKLTEEIGTGYHRLMTFYYKEKCEKVLNVAQKLKGKENENRPNRVKKQISRLTPRVG